MEYSDWELVREIKNGNEDAMEILVRRWYPQVFRYVMQIIESEQDSYDVTQDISVGDSEYFKLSTTQKIWFMVVYHSA